MTEQELKKVVEEIVGALARRGLLTNPPASGVPAPRAAEPSSPPKTTIGTAGKVFSGEWSYSAPSKSAPAAAKSCKGEGECGCEGCESCEAGESCKNCEKVASLSEGDVKALGADRVALCRPSKKCSSVARLVDHTLLKPNATQSEIGKLCEEARAYCFASVCVNPSYVPLAAKLLSGSGVKVCTVIGFPLGSTTSTVKAIEARDAIANGADEIDMVINVGALKSGNDAAVFEDIKAVREATRGKVLKTILETALLTKEEKVRACLLAKKAEADFVKTSTGFGGGGATVEDIRLMRETVGPRMGVKASGGVRDAEAAQAMIKAGATRLGTSASVAIVTGETGSGKGY